MATVLKTLRVVVVLETTGRPGGTPGTSIPGLPPTLPVLGRRTCKLYCVRLEEASKGIGGLVHPFPPPGFPGLPGLSGFGFVIKTGVPVTGVSSMLQTLLQAVDG